MRWALCVLLLAGCRQVLGIDTPGLSAPDASASDVDAAITDGMPFLDASACADADQDGVCDLVDDWPCGAKPVAPPANLELTRNNTDTDFKMTNIAIDGMGTLAIVAHGAPLHIQMSLLAKDKSCGNNCIDQLEIGFAPTPHPSGCVFDHTVMQAGTNYTIDDLMITAPTTPGLYSVLANIGQNLSCSTTAWYGTTLPTTYIAKICVQ